MFFQDYYKPFGRQIDEQITKIYSQVIQACFILWKTFKTFMEYIKDKTFMEYIKDTTKGFH